MTLFMNEKDMNEMLDGICPEGETYQGKAWGTLMSGTAEMLALGAVSNVYWRDRKNIGYCSVGNF